MADTNLSIAIQLQDDASAKILSFKESVAQLQQEMAALHTPAQQVSQDISEIGNSAQQGTEKTNSLLSGFRAFSALYLGERIFRTVADDITASLKAYNEDEAAIANLNSRIQSTGGVAGVTSEAAQNLAGSLAQVTTFSKSTTLQAEAVGLTFTNISRDIFPQTIKVAQDMATVMGGDLNEAVLRIGKALQDPINGVANLRREGVNLTQQQQEMLKAMVNTGQGAQAQKWILQELEREFGGAAEAVGQTFGGQMKILQNNFEELQAEIGQLISVALGPLLSKFENLLSHNSTLVISVGAAVGVVGLFTGAVLIGAGALGIMGLAASALEISIFPLIAALALVAAAIGYLVYGTVTDFENKTHSLQQGVQSLSASFSQGQAPVQQFGTTVDNTGKQIKKINEEIDRSNQNFKERMADLVNSIKQKQQDLVNSIADEKKSFEDSQADMLASFQQSQEDQKTSHEDKVSSIQQQIQEETDSYTQQHDELRQNFQNRIDYEAQIGGQAAQDRINLLVQQYNLEVQKQKETSDKKIAQLNDSITKENKAYDEQQAKSQERYQADVDKATEAHNKKLADLQKSLDEETTILNNHKNEVLAVQDVQSRDEITKLIDTHNQELAQYEQQKRDIIANANQTAGGVTNAFNGIPKAINLGDFSNVGKQMGENLGKALKDSLKQQAIDMLDFLRDSLSIENIKRTIPLFAGAGGSQAAKNALNLLKIGLGIDGRASGGAVLGNTPYVVGEKGPEIFVPSSSGSIIPNHRMGGMNVSINIYGNVSTAGGTSDIENLAKSLGQQIMRAQGGI